MRFTTALLLGALAFPAVAQAETRLIAVDIRPVDHSKQLFVSVFSSVNKEKKSGITIQEAADFLRNATGAGSVALVGIQAHDVQLQECMPILDAITQNGTLLLAFLEGTRSGFITDNLRKMMSQEEIEKAMLQRGGIRTNP